MRVALVANIPDQTVPWSVKDPVQRNRQLHNPKTSAQMTAGDRDLVHKIGAQLICNLPELCLVQSSQIVGIIDLIQQWRLRRCSHTNLTAGQPYAATSNSPFKTPVRAKKRPDRARRSL